MTHSTINCRSVHVQCTSFAAAIHEIVDAINSDHPLQN
jgi:hypothetical protein